MQARQIILDTETTGLNPEKGDRVVEIAAIEIREDDLTDKEYQTFLNPGRESSPEALKVHGLTSELLATKPKFSEIVDNFLQFVTGAELIIHNASFDVKFLNNELKLVGKAKLEDYCPKITDTVNMSRKLYSKEFLTTQLISKRLVEDELLVKEEKAKAENEAVLIDSLIKNSKFRVHSLDHLCKFYGVNLAAREKHHGALIDCKLLGQVYMNLKKDFGQNKKTFGPNSPPLTHFNIPRNLSHNSMPIRPRFR